MIRDWAQLWQLLPRATRWQSVKVGGGREGGMAVMDGSRTDEERKEPLSEKEDLSVTQSWAGRRRR